MKKNKIYGLSFLLLVLTFIYIGTYAYYMRVVEGKIKANTGAFTFDVLYNNATFREVDLASTTGISNKTVIVPGDKGRFDLVAKGTGSNVDIEYTITFNGGGVPSNMIFYLDENKTKVLDIETNTIEGVLLTSGTMEKTHTIYWEWPYDSGRYNELDYEYQDKSIEIGVSITGKQVTETNLIYGIRRDTNSTSTEWGRIEASIGLEANAVLSESGSTTVANTEVKNDFDKIYPWSNIRSYNYDASKKKVTAWYGDSNFAFDGSNGEVLTFIPGFWYKREVVDGVEYQYISKYEQSGYSYSEPFSVGRYKMSGGREAQHENTTGTSNNNYNDNIKLMVTDSVSSEGTVINDGRGRSKNGVYPSASATISDFRERASMLGNEFSILDYHWYVLQMLYLVEYADYDSQTKLGKGVTENNDGAIIMGGTDSLGMQSGCLINDGAHSIIYRGIEDIYGNTADFLDGINIKDYQAYINYDFITYESDVFDGNYKALGYINKSFGDDVEFGYITKLGYDSNNQLIGLPTEVESITDENENNPVGLKDLYASGPGSVVIIVGGSYRDYHVAGLWNISATDGSKKTSFHEHIGSRLIRHQTRTGREVQETITTK